MKKIVIEEMICSKCAEKIEKKISSLEGVEEVKVLLSEKEAYVSGKVNEEILKLAIESEGYEVTSMEEVEGFTRPEEKKGFFRRLLGKIEDSNKKSFGSGRMDCCDLGKKGHEKREKK